MVQSYSVTIVSLSFSLFLYFCFECVPEIILQTQTCNLIHILCGHLQYVMFVHDFNLMHCLAFFVAIYNLVER